MSGDLQTFQMFVDSKTQSRLGDSTQYTNSVPL